MKLSSILYWVSFACLATIVPLSLPAQAETSSPNSIEITRQESNRVKSDSNRDKQGRESKHVERRDRQGDRNREQKGERKNRDGRDSNREHEGKDHKQGDRHNEHR